MKGETDPKRMDGSPKWGLAVAGAAAVGVSVCCVGPLLLLALGIGGAWIGNLTAMEKYRPIWMAATLVFLGLAFVRVYRKPKEEACAPGSTCPPKAGRRNKVLLWIVTALVLGLLALPYLIQYVPYAFAGGHEKAPVTREVSLSVRNMTCSACPVTVKMSLARVDGVRDAKVTLDPPRAVITYDPAKVGPEQLIEATTRAGFPSTVMHEGRRNTAMKVEVLYFEGCPNHAPALEMVQRVLEREKIKAKVMAIEVLDDKAANALRFLGSPSVLVDGVDVEPGRDGDSPFFGCRTYSVEGKTAGIPPEKWVVDALRRGIRRGVE